MTLIAIGHIITWFLALATTVYYLRLLKKQPKGEKTTIVYSDGGAPYSQLYSAKSVWDDYQADKLSVVSAILRVDSLFAARLEEIKDWETIDWTTSPLEPQKGRWRWEADKLVRVEEPPAPTYAPFTGYLVPAAASATYYERHTPPPQFVVGEHHGSIVCKGNVFCNSKPGRTITLGEMYAVREAFQQAFMSAGFYATVYAKINGERLHVELVYAMTQFAPQRSFHVDLDHDAVRVPAKSVQWALELVYEGELAAARKAAASDPFVRAVGDPRPGMKTGGTL